MRLYLAAILIICTGQAQAATGTASPNAAPTVANPWQGAKLFDCAKLQTMACDDLKKQHLEDVKQCMQRAADPPLCMPPEGAKVNGSGSNFFGGVQDPAIPPFKAGAKPSVGNFSINFSLKFPPWSSSDDNPHTTTNPTAPGTGTCPEQVNADNTFGTSAPLTGGNTLNLTCGGAIPLSAYPMTVSRNPTGFAATEFNSYFLWAYTLNGNRYTATSSAPLALPHYLCSYNKKRNRMEKSVDLPGPLAQMITYNSSMNALLLRLQPLPAVTNPLTGVATDDVPAGPEKYLTIPLLNGQPQIPADCANEADYYKTAISGGDLMIEPATEASCESTPDICSAAGAGATTPAVPASCETATTYPAGTTQTANGAVACTGKIQIMVVDRPNLLHLPGAAITSKAIDGRTAVMADSSAGSQLYVSSTTSLRLPHSGQSFTFPGGGMVTLDNDSTLTMNGPATINTGTGQVMLTAGGDLRDTSGTVVANYADGVTLTPTIAWPWRVTPNGGVELPVGYSLPTQPAPYVRGPAGE